MSNIFNIKRFSKVVIRDIVSNCLILAFRGLLFFGVYYLLIALGKLLIVDDFANMSALFRYKVINYLSIVMMLIVPFVLYNNVSNRKKGVDYIMLPASSLEKYLSMLIVTIIIGQVIVLLSGFAIDTIFSVIFSNMFDGFAISKIDFMGILNNQKKVLVLVSIGIAGNLMFRKHKVLKTLSVFIVFTLIFILCSINYVANMFVNQKVVSINNKEYTLKDLNKESNIKELATSYIEYDENKQIKEYYKFEDLKKEFGVNDSTIVDFKSLIKNAGKSYKYSMHKVNLNESNYKNDIKYSIDFYELSDNEDKNEEYGYAIINKDNAEYFLKINSNISDNFFTEQKELFKDFLSKINVFLMWVFPIILLLLSYIRLKKIQM